MTKEREELWQEWLKTDEGRSFDAIWGGADDPPFSARGKMWVAQRMIERRNAMITELVEALELCRTKALCIFPQHDDDKPCDGCRGWRLARALLPKAKELNS